MTVIVYLFLFIFLVTAFIGIIKPLWLLTSFETLSKVLNIKKDKVPKVTLITTQVICGFCLAFGVFVVLAVLDGRVVF